MELQRTLRFSVESLVELEANVRPRPGEVRLERRGTTAWLLLDNPDAHNALTVRMMRQLAEAYARLVQERVAVAVLASGSGASFCSGGHLGQVRDSLLDPQAGRRMSRAMTLLLNAWSAAPMVTVAVVRGPAVGGGVELVSACDLCVASPDARFDPAQVRLGVAAGWGGAGRLVRRLGPSAALRFLLRSEPVTASQALELGVIDQLARGDATAMVEALLGPGLSHEPAAIRALKAQIAKPDDPSSQAEAFLEVWGSAAHRRALGLPS